MTNSGTLQVTTPSNRKVAMTDPMHSEMRGAVTGAMRAPDRRRSVAMLWDGASQF